MEKPFFTLQTLQRALLNEIGITTRLLHSNVASTFCIMFGGLIPRAVTGVHVHNPLVLVLKAFVAAIIFAYVFDICNQTMSVEEDSRNRPSRPVPAGLLTVEGAYRRWAFTWLLAPMGLFAVGGVDASFHLACWEAWILFCHVWPKPGHWLFKNLFTAVGTFSLLRILNDLMVTHAPLAEMSIALDIFCCAWVFSTVHVQDFHDVEGDRATGRRTLPVILQPSTLWCVRQCTAFVLVSTIILLLVAEYLEFWHERTWFTSLLAAPHFVGACATAVRVSRIETTDQAEETYKSYYLTTAALLEIHISMINALMG